MTTPDLSRMMVISVHPRHVERILEGSKTVELRRTRPLIEPGQAAVIYATMPRGALVATCRISRVETGSPTELWETVQSIAQVARADFDQYYQYSSQAVALHLSEVQPLQDHVTLGQLRSRAKFHPPQTWQFIDEQHLRCLLGSHPSAEEVAALIRC